MRINGFNIFSATVVAVSLITGPSALAQIGPPVVNTEPPSALSSSNAMLSGTVNPNGWPIAVWFEWGHGSFNNTAGMTTLDGGNATFPMRATVNGLTAGWNYSYRLVASNSAVIVYGAVQNLVVPYLPVVNTEGASSVTSGEALLHGTVNPGSWPTTAWFEWGPTTQYGFVSSLVDVGSSNQVRSVAQSIGPLVSLTDYHFRLVATNAGGVAYGEDMTFKTPVGPGTPAGVHVTPTALMPGDVVTANYVGGEFPIWSTPANLRIRMIGIPIDLQLVSANPTNLVFITPAWLGPGLYGFVLQEQLPPPLPPGQWVDRYVSPSQLLRVGLPPLTTKYQGYQRGSVMPLAPGNFLGNSPSNTATGVIAGYLNSFGVVNDGDSWGNFEWTKDFPWSGKNGVKITFDFRLEDNAWFDFRFPFEVTTELPSTVYRGQDVRFTPASFRFTGGDTLSVSHRGKYSFDHQLWLNVPYDSLSALDIRLSQQPNRLIVSGKVPLAPDIPPGTEIYGDFDDGDATINGVHNRLGGVVVHANYFNRVVSMPHEPTFRQVWTGEGRIPGFTDLWYSGGDQVFFLCGVPGVQVAAIPLSIAGVELNQTFYIDVLCTDIVEVKLPWLEFQVHIPTNAPSTYNIVTNLSFPVQIDLISTYIYELHGGMSFDMPFIDETEIWSVPLGNIYVKTRREPFTNLQGEFNLNATVNTIERTNWIREYSPFLPLNLDADAMNYTPAEASAARARLASLAFPTPAVPLLISLATNGTFATKPESEMALVLSRNPLAGGTVTLTPPPVDGGYFNGTVVTLTAQPAAGYQFAGWSGDITGMNNPATITMNDIKSVTANFATVTITGPGYSTNGTFHFDVGGISGMTGIVQWSTNLTTPVWWPLVTNVSPFRFTDTNASSYPQRFYRVLLLP